MEPSAETSSQKKPNTLWEFLKFVVIALLIVIPVRMFIAQPFVVSGSSMEPTFHHKEYLIIDEVGYRFHEPTFGDVIVFRYPEDPSKFFIKRVIGLPGDIIEINRGTITRNGTTLDEPYTSSKTFTKGFLRDGIPYTVSEGEYLVFGDNREASSDSRVWGPLPEENIIGRAWLRVLPLRLWDHLPGSVEEASARTLSVSNE